ncbi:alpha/beta hydrolase family protein [Noviherbaspirillum sp.]|uniref:alpha/beta hydrolase family protein n=1 Tax=Noviherbaspirillum sp. TaxID=1926288 RepID=UPI002FE1E93A
MRYRLSIAQALFAMLLALFALAAHSSVGVMEIEGKDGDGPVTLFYPTSSDAASIQRGPFTLQLATDGMPVQGNGRLIVISHGSGGSPWPYTDLARALVEKGFVVAMPEHRGDNDKDASTPGPESWKRRPAEVSRAIDATGRDPRFGRLLRLDKVGMYGMSAGGHTALTLAGGRWSPSQLRRHCEAHLSEDFNGCVGLATRLTGGMLDGLKKAISLSVIRQKLDDTAWYTYSDPRITAVVAGVPFASDFDMASLAVPRTALGIVTAGGDKWLRPQFHSTPVLRACTRCELVAELANGGHGALLSPLPEASGLLRELLADPPGFDRAILPAIDQKIVLFFERHLLP